MSDTDIRVRQIIAEELGRPLASVVPASRLGYDLGVARDDLAYLIGVIETDFGVMLDANGLPADPTVGAIIRLVAGELAGYAPRGRR